MQLAEVRSKELEICARGSMRFLMRFSPNPRGGIRVCWYEVKKLAVAQKLLVAPRSHFHALKSEKEYSGPYHIAFARDGILRFSATAAIFHRIKNPTYNTTITACVLVQQAN